MARFSAWLAGALAIAAAGCDQSVDTRCANNRCDEAGTTVLAPSTPAPAGDPAAGRAYLIDGDYIQSGVPDVLFPLTKSLFGDLANGPPLPGRAAHNTDLPYFLSRHDNTGTGVEVVAETCLLCHAAPLRGEVVIGLGDSRRDFTADVSKLARLIPDIPAPSKTIKELNKILGRLEVFNELTRMPSIGTNPADTLTMMLMAKHDPATMAFSEDDLMQPPTESIPVDVPPWWTLHKKNAAFYGATGVGADFRGTMILATLSCTDDVGSVNNIMARFADVQAWLMTLRAPPYPFPIDAPLAAQGKQVFDERCEGCHGSYGASDDQESFPNRLVPVGEVGTDPLAANGFFQRQQFVDWFNRSPYGQLSHQEIRVEPRGYLAQPLDGIWATAPYLHNASVPTLAALLRAKDRPVRWTRTDFDNQSYDEVSVGWTSRAVSGDELAKLDRKLVYDTTLPGQSNRGHDYADDLSDEEVTALLEYLKTL